MAARVINQSPSDAVIAIKKAAKIRTKKTSHGNGGEKLVLRTLRTDPEYKTVIHASLKNQRLGYDIRTINNNGQEEFHEVKSSSKKNFNPSTWYIASNQYETAIANAKKYFFWFVNALNTEKPSIKKLRPEQLDFMPSRFQVTVGSDYKPYYDMTFKAKALLDELESQYQSPRTVSMRNDKSELEDRQLIAQAVLTRKFLAERLTSYRRDGINNLDYNFDQVNSRKPYHLKYTDKDGKTVYVDIKVTLDDAKRSFGKTTFRFNVTKNRLEQAMKLNSSSDHRREFWYCRLDKERKELYVRVYDVSGKNFWNSPKNQTDIDYYSFKLKT